MSEKLTPKQQRFVTEYLRLGNATQAAKEAGYSEKTAFRIGTENLQKPAIARAIERAQARRNDRLELEEDFELKKGLELGSGYGDLAVPYRFLERMREALPE